METSPKPNSDKPYNYEISSLKAFITVGRALIFSEDMFDGYENELFEKIKEEGISEHVLENSIEYGEEVAKHILEWADKDNYKQTRTFPKYSIRDDEHSKLTHDG